MADAGFEELSNDNIHNKELYLALAVLPKGLAFDDEVAALLLYGEDWSPEDLAASKIITTTLERFSVLPLEDSGKYRVHDSHADFVRARLPKIQACVIQLCRSGGSTFRGLLTWPGETLVGIWRYLAMLERKDVISNPDATALDSKGLSNTTVSTTLGNLANCYWLRGQLDEVDIVWNQMFTIVESDLERKFLDVPTIRNALGVCASKWGGLEEGREFLRQGASSTNLALAPHTRQSSR